MTAIRMCISSTGVFIFCNVGYDISNNTHMWQLAARKVSVYYNMHSLFVWCLPKTGAAIAILDKTVCTIIFAAAFCNIMQEKEL